MPRSPRRPSRGARGRIGAKDKEALGDDEEALEGVEESDPTVAEGAGGAACVVERQAQGLVADEPREALVDERVPEAPAAKR
eukprot:454217-Alexandrium_andersonii.AAC.1